MDAVLNAILFKKGVEWEPSLKLIESELLKYVAGCGPWCNGLSQELWWECWAEHCLQFLCTKNPDFYLSTPTPCDFLLRREKLTADHFRQGTALLLANLVDNLEDKPVAAAPVSGLSVAGGLSV